METGADGKQRTVTEDQGLKVHKKLEREAYLIERGKTLEPLGINKKDEM